MARPRVKVLLTRPVYNRPPVTRKRVHGEGNTHVEDSLKTSPPLARAHMPTGEGPYFSRDPDRRPGASAPARDGHAHASASEELPDERRKHSVESLLDQASTLTREQQRELLDHLALRNQLTQKAADNRDLDMWSTSIGTALAAAIGDEEHGSYGQLLIKRLLGSTQCWRPVEAFMTSSKLCELRVVERQAVYNLLAQLLVEHAGHVAKRSGAPLGPKLIGQCTGSLPGVFEASFPGYLAAGLAPMVARQMGARRIA